MLENNTPRVQYATRWTDQDPDDDSKTCVRYVLGGTGEEGRALAANIAAQTRTLQAGRGLPADATVVTRIIPAWVEAGDDDRDIVVRCPCGQPLGVCACGETRCWHCDPPRAGCAHAADQADAGWRARAEAAQRMLDATRAELHAERVEHGAAVARLARLAAAVEAVLAHKLDGGEALAELARVHQEVIRVPSEREPS